MKRVLFSVLSALLLAAPVALYASEPAASYSFDKKKTNSVTVTYNVNMHCEKCVNKIKENISFMKDFQPLSETEQQAVAKVKEIFQRMNLVPCTSCHYCIEENHCPKDILIPDMFACLNAKKMFNDWNQRVYYRNELTQGGHGKASDCLKCGKCEKVCPQHLEIRKLLTQVAETFE